MSSLPGVPAGLPPLSYVEMVTLLRPENDLYQDLGNMSISRAPSEDTATLQAPLSQALNSPDGISCFGNERLMLQEQAKLCNSERLSDITLIVGGNKFYAHKMILVRASDVFDNMLTGQWKDSGKKELELTEEPMCVGVFSRFLKYLYSCNIQLNMENSLPIFVLADKYNVTDLQAVCSKFACLYIIPKLQLKDVFHVWFQYATKCQHMQLVHACIKAMAEKMEEIIGSLEWESEWLGLDRDQLIKFLDSSDLRVKDEFHLWKAAVKWLTCSKHLKRAERFAENLAAVLPYIRFPMMTAEQIHDVEYSPIAQEYPSILQNYFMLSYKYHALPLSMRACVKEFKNQSFLLRNYNGLRWDCRFVISNYSACVKGEEKVVHFVTRSSYPSQTWNWELKIYPKGISSSPDDFRVVLYSNLIHDQLRPMEYLLSLVSRHEILHSVCGKKNFSKTRYLIDTEMDKKISVAELCQPNSPLLVDNCLIIQIILKLAA